MDTSIQNKVQEFFKKYPKKKFLKGDIIITPEKTPNGIYCLVEGIVRSFVISKNGVDLTLNMFKPTSFFPMQWIINEKQDRYYYEAVTNVEVFCAPKTDFSRFIQTEHDVSYDLLKRIYRGLEGYMLKMESLLEGNARIRTVTVLQIHALRFKNKENTVALSLTHADIASESGLSRETVTREMKVLKQKGIIKYAGKTLVIADIQRLEQEMFE